MNLETFLREKPLYYDTIDYERFPNIYKNIAKYFKLPRIIHVVGTNAKGSTGRALAYMLVQKGFRTAHYSSPHILRFNERIWLNGADVSDAVLEETHESLQALLGAKSSDALSYFEYTTLLAMLIFGNECEYVVLEAGLGGEFDATQVFAKELSIVTPIGYDHQAFLGNDIEDIAKTKIASVNNPMILARQSESCVYKIAFQRASQIRADLYLAQNYLPSSQMQEISEFVHKKGLAPFFVDNLATAFCAFCVLGFDFDIKYLDSLEFFGRCYKLNENITIDVGHNTMAALGVLEFFKDQKVILIYNSYNDKEYKKILSILKPIILQVQIIDIKSERALQKCILEQTLCDLQIEHSTFSGVTKSDKYLAFGSFAVVAAFMDYYERKKA